jgi:transglutaminase-like putative cysteine protease
MKFKLGCRLGYNVASPAPFLFNIAAQRLQNQVVEEERLTLTPELQPEHWTMPESCNRYFRVNAPPGRLVVEYQAQVNLSPSLEDPASVNEFPVARLPLPVFPHLFPSRYCQSDKLDRFARSTFGALHPGYARVNGICNWIHDYVSYEGGVSDAMTSAFDTVTQRAGVCRDFAHLAIALCRALGIPARYVSAYAFRLQPADFHAVFEAYLEGSQGGGWYLFDATRMSDAAGLVRIGVGRDAADVAFCTPYGQLSFDKPEVWIEPIGTAAAATTQAVRLGAS